MLSEKAGFVMVYFRSQAPNFTQTEFAFPKFHMLSLSLRGGFAQGQSKVARFGTRHVCSPQMYVGQLFEGTGLFVCLLGKGLEVAMLCARKFVGV